jgi:predicted DNA-binding protein
MTNATTTIRVSTATRDRLSSIAKRRGKTTGDLLAEVAFQLDEDALLEAAEASWARMDEGTIARYRDEAGDLEGFAAPLHGAE